MIEIVSGTRCTRICFFSRNQGKYIPRFVYAQQRLNIGELSANSLQLLDGRREGRE